LVYSKVDEKCGIKKRQLLNGRFGLLNGKRSRKWKTGKIVAGCLRFGKVEINRVHSGRLSYAISGLLRIDSIKKGSLCSLFAV